MRLTLASLLLILMLTACATEPGAPEPVRQVEVTGPSADPELRGRTRLWLEMAEVDAEHTRVVVRYQRGDNAVGPRVAELRLRHANLELKTSQAGEATTSAGKELIVQAPEPELARLIVLSQSSVTPLDTGALAVLEFERSANGPASVEILTDRPLLAPEEAATGLLVDGALEL